MFFWKLGLEEVGVYKMGFGFLKVSLLCKERYLGSTVAERHDVIASSKLLGESILSDCIASVASNIL